jgi:hypothetical protein
MPIKTKQIHEIDWYKVQGYFGTNESDPEGIVHEIVHAYECKGKDTLIGKIGNQDVIDKLVTDKYKRSSSRGRHEIRVSAATFLILESFGQTNLKEVLSAMLGNLKSERGWLLDPDESKILFLSHLSSSRVRYIVSNVQHFLAQQFAK